MAGLVALAAGGLALTGCGGGPPDLQVQAVFSDVNDLVAGAPVQLADITVGSVQSISLDGDRARVVMAIDPTADVPAQVEAELQQTTILGEHFVALVPKAGATGRIRNGATITDTTVVPGIEQLVQSGAEVFGALSAAQVAELIDNSAEGFGGQGPELRSLLDDFGTVLGGYAGQSAQITNVVDRIDQLTSTLAPDAQSGATAVANLAQTTSVLAQQSDRFTQLLQSLDALAGQGQSILATGTGQIEDQIDALGAVARQLATHQADLATVLKELPAHNTVLSKATVDDYVQILDDVIVCGLPNGGGDTTSPDATCNPSGGGS